MRDKNIDPMVRTLVLGVSLPFVACTASPVAFRVGEVVGDYRFTIGPDEREELHIQAEGRLAWERFSNLMLRERGFGKWILSGHEITVDLPGFSFALHGTSATLALRRFGGHVYLVRDEDLALFETPGPMEEFCFARYGAPLVTPPPHEVVEIDAATAARLQGARAADRRER